MSAHPPVFVVMESVDGIPSERIRRVFDNREAAEAYRDDPENVGNLRIDTEPLYEEWPA